MSTDTCFGEEAPECIHNRVPHPHTDRMLSEKTTGSYFFPSLLFSYHTGQHIPAFTNTIALCASLYKPFSKKSSTSLSLWRACFCTPIPVTNQSHKLTMSSLACMLLHADSCHQQKSCNNFTDIPVRGPAMITPSRKPFSGVSDIFHGYLIYLIPCFFTLISALFPFPPYSPSNDHFTFPSNSKTASDV